MTDGMKIWRRALTRPKLGARIKQQFASCALLLVLLLAGCDEAPSTLQPGGPGADSIATLWWLLFGMGTAIYIGVMAYLLLALFRRRNQQPQPEAGANEGVRGVILGGAVFTTIVLVIVFGLTLNTLFALSARDDAVAEDLVIEVIGHQWWWEVRYPNHEFSTANELHIPVGEPVRLILRSEDVIHSFWVPELHGKLDMIPNDVNTMWLQADQAGEYWGECAEFCGIQHAKMQFVVVAEAADEFAAWIAQQQLPAPDPSDPVVLEGQQVFLGSACVYCHTVRGTNATGDLGPDLTHLASRLTIGAGALPNNRGNLAGWIIDPHSIKPGNLMPPTNLSGPELQAMLAYLETLE